jgi:hypothetical protein
MPWIGFVLSTILFVFRLCFSSASGAKVARCIAISRDDDDLAVREIITTPSGGLGFLRISRLFYNSGRSMV